MMSCCPIGTRRESYSQYQGARESGEQGKLGQVRYLVKRVQLGWEVSCDGRKGWPVRKESFPL